MAGIVEKNNVLKNLHKHDPLGAEIEVQTTVNSLGFLF